MSSFHVRQRPRHCVLIGNYGAGNIGDEALREYFLGAFPEVQWTVVTRRAGGQEGRRAEREVPRFPFGIRSFFRPWWRTIAAILGSDAVVFGGGSLFTDGESVFACVLWWWHAFIARCCGKPLLMAFQGVGPFRTRSGAFLARNTFVHAAFISVRDEESLARISRWKLRTTPILSFDPVFKVFAARERSTSTKKILNIIPRGNADEQFFRTVSEKLAAGWDDIHVLLLQPERERGVAARIVAMSSGKAKVVEIVSVEQLLEASMSSEVITQRYHGALAALAIGVPVTIVPQAAGDKMDGLRLYEQEGPGSQSRLLKRVEAGESALRCALHSYRIVASH